eukprot:9476378-Pyramimonas_sp.AAC.1
MPHVERIRAAAYLRGRVSQATRTRQLTFTKRPWAFTKQPCPVRFLAWVRLLNGFACRGDSYGGGLGAL